MSVNMTAFILMFVIFLIGIFIGFEIPASLFISAVICCLYAHIPIMTVLAKGISMISSPSILAIPMFICAGTILGKTAISDQLIDLADECVGWMRGGLAITNVLASIFFGGISGSPVADIYSLGTILVPEMEKRGYDREFSTAVTGASALEGILIPPSHNMLMYCMAAMTVVGSINVGKCLLAGIAPGVMMGTFMAIYAYYLAVQRGYPKGRPFSLSRLLKTASKSIWGLMTIVIIIVGTATGICTTTEAAAISIVWALFVSKMIYHNLSLKKFWDILGSCIILICRMGFNMAVAGGFSFLIAYLRIPMMITDYIAARNMPGWMVLILINVALVLMGMFMSMSSTILIVTPIFLPICMSFGMDPITFGVMLMINLGMGLLTPPVGAALTACHVISDVSIERVAKELLPWEGIMLLSLLLVVIFPQITLFLPNMMK